MGIFNLISFLISCILINWFQLLLIESEVIQDKLVYSLSQDLGVGLFID